MVVFLTGGLSGVLSAAKAGRSPGAANKMRSIKQTLTSDQSLFIVD
jgi:hypothetical protein